MKHLVLLLSIAALLFSCSGDTGKTVQTVETKDTLPAKEKFETGKVLDKVMNRNDASQSYAIYLPSDYSFDKTWPVYFFFDAHAAGKLPVTKYKDLAEKYGYILVGSNNSRNGVPWDQTQNIAGMMFADIQERLAINTSRIYLCGFSGGARVANGLCILNGGIAGAICCGAAAPAANSKDPRSNYTFLGICGNLDFNYVEMRKYDMVDLAGRNIKHAFVEFDGKHEWPDEGTMNNAFLWTELCDMRAKRIPINDSLVSANIEPMAEQINDLRKEGKAFEAFTLLKREVNFFDGVANVSGAIDMYKKYKDDPVIDKALKKEEAIWKKEEELQKFYQNAFQNNSLEWWRADIAAMNKKIKNSDSDESKMYQRTMDYLSLVSYMQTNSAMEKNNLPVIRIFSGIYLLVDPTNSEAHYLAAKVDAVEGKEKEMFARLNAAVDNGFKDLERIQKDPPFTKYATTDEFRAILQRINTAIASDTL